MKPDWSTAPAWAMFAAMDYDRQWCWHSHEPRASGKVWMPPEDGTWKRASELDQRDWRDTLDRRTPEPAGRECETCGGAGTVDETLGGYHFSNPRAECPDCDGIGEYATTDSTAAGDYEGRELDRIEFALRDAGFDYDLAFRIAHIATIPEVGQFYEEHLRRLSRREGA